MKDVIVYAEHRSGAPAKSRSKWRRKRARSPTRSAAKRTRSSSGRARRLAEQLNTLSARRRARQRRSRRRPVFCSTRWSTTSKRRRAPRGPSLMLVPNTLSGRDVAGRLVARLEAGIGADVTDFTIEDGARRVHVAENGRRADHDLRDQAGRLRHRDRPPERLRGSAGRQRGSRAAAREAGRQNATAAIVEQTSKKARANSRWRKRRSSWQAAAGLAGRNRSTRC